MQKRSLRGQPYDIRPLHGDLLLAYTENENDEHNFLTDTTFHSFCVMSLSPSSSIRH